MLFTFHITVGARKNAVNHYTVSPAAAAQTLMQQEEERSLPAFVLLVIKRQGQHSTHNLCVKVPFLNATKGQEVVIHRRNYGCTRRRAE